MLVTEVARGGVFTLQSAQVLGANGALHQHVFLFFSYVKLANDRMTKSIS
jgi:hypothetical protein